MLGVSASYIIPLIEIVNNVCAKIYMKYQKKKRKKTIQKEIIVIMHDADAAVKGSQGNIVF